MSVVKRRSAAIPSAEKRKVGGSIPPLATTISAGSGLGRITRHNPWPDLRPFHAANIRPSRVLAARRKIARHAATNHFPWRFFKRALVRRRILGIGSTTSQKRERGCAAIARLFGQMEGPALSVADAPARLVGGEQAYPAIRYSCPRYT